MKRLFLLLVPLLLAGVFVTGCDKEPVGDKLQTTRLVRLDDPGLALDRVQMGQPITGELTDEDRQLFDGTLFDLYRYRASHGERFTLQLTSGDFDPYLLIARATGDGNFRFIASDDDSGGDYDAQLSLTMPDENDFYVFVNAAGAGQAGAYTLTITQQPSLAVADSVRYGGTGDPSDKYALLVGLDENPPGLTDLSSTVADVELMHDVLINDYGFSPQNVVTLTDRQATRGAILHAFMAHLGQAGPEGIAVFYYSGHGGQFPDEGVKSPDDYEPDGLDEGIAVWCDGACPQGSMGVQWTAILDDEFAYLIDNLKTDRVLTIFDACHSGTTTRGEMQTAAKFVDWDDPQVKQAYTAPEDWIVDATTRFSAAMAAQDEAATTEPASRYAELFSANPRNHILLAASDATETSWAWIPEATALDPGYNRVASVFTHYLVQSLRRADNSATFEQVMALVRANTRELTFELTNQYQTPQVEGTQADTPVAVFLRKPTRQQPLRRPFN